MSVVSRALRPFQQFAATESAGGIVLLACTGVALAWANSPWSDAYFRLWEQQVHVGVGTWSGSMTLHHWINDGLMAVFFFLVGLEIKRELLAGELASARQAALPVGAAIGGMVLPAVVYAAVTHGTQGARGWAIPMATDIAFALGVLSLLGARVRPPLKVFLTALAIVDDLGAVLVIALVFSTALSPPHLIAAAGLVVALAICNRLHVRRASIYAGLGLLLWAAMLMSGIHATIAGILLAMTIPSRTAVGSVQAPLLTMERALHRTVAFGIMPLFAFANAGVRLAGGDRAVIDWRIVAAIILGLVVGKSVGIAAVSWGVIKAGIAAPLADVRWSQLYGVSWLGGIGFTMSLFVAGLAFGESALLDSAKIGILAGSVLAGSVGWSILRWTLPPPGLQHPT